MEDKNREDNLTVEMEDFFETTIEELEQYEKSTWETGTGYEAPNFPMFSEKIEGLDAGLFMFAGESNHGKSALALSLAWDFATNPANKLFCLYFALDDTAKDLIPRIVAMNKEIPISAVAKPQRYLNVVNEGGEYTELYQNYLNKRTEGLKELAEQNSHFKIIDGIKISNGEQILDYCRKAQMYVKALDPENDILVVIDSLSDITFGSKSFKSDKELNDYIAKQVKKWAVEILNVPIFGTLHLRKIEQNRRPNVSDVKESGRYVYEASALFLVHNDVSRNKQSASIYSVLENSQEKMPVIELDWAKNKKSSFKGRTYHNFIPNYSKVTECGKDASDRFNHLIYSV